MKQMSTSLTTSSLRQTVLVVAAVVVVVVMVLVVVVVVEVVVVAVAACGPQAFRQGHCSLRFTLSIYQEKKVEDVVTALIQAKQALLINTKCWVVD
jgi:hypothetical protein